MAYLPLSTANLPDPVIDPAQGASPADHFDAVTYTGNGTSRTIPLDFATDFVWAKRRDGVEQHGLIDVVRGGDKYLDSGATTAEGTSSTITFGSSGMNLVGANWNGNLNTYVAWNWKANGTGVSNTDGSITSTVSANTTSGFSIVKFIGDNDGANTSKTIGHGLSNPPEVVIIKQTELNAWYVYHKSLGATQVINLDQTVAASTNASVWNNTAPDSNVFTVGWNGGANGDTKTHISYCFHSVEGFSKFGSYVGNGSTDGSFIYTGFRPAFLLLKVTSVADDWIIWDGVRSPENLADNALKPNSSAAEVTGNINNSIDLVSNGFKCRNANEKTNFSGYNYIYMAFAENPFKYSNAR